MPEKRKFTEQDRINQRNNIRIAREGLERIAGEHSHQGLGVVDDAKEKRSARHDCCRLLHEIEGLQHVIVLHGGEQPRTWLPFLATHAVERAKREGIPGRDE